MTRRILIALVAVLQLLPLSAVAFAAPAFAAQNPAPTAVRPAAKLPVPPKWGSHSLITPDMDHNAKAALMDQAQAAGAQIIRLEFFWKSVEETKGVYSWDLTDDMVTLAQQRNMQILALVAY